MSPMNPNLIAFVIHLSPEKYYEIHVFQAIINLVVPNLFYMLMILLA